MGLERECKAVINGRRLEGVAHLEPGELRFAAATTVRVPLDKTTRAVAREGRLEIEWAGGTASFELGREAEAWALKIRYPRGRLDKLGVALDTIVSVVGLKDAAFDAELATRTSQVTSGRVRKGSQLAIVAARALADLDRLSSYREAIAGNGAIWVVWTKGQKALTETHVRAAAKAQGLVDVKVMSFSDELSGLKLVIPVALRKEAPATARSIRKAKR
jgi:hypothetical protein